MNTRIQQLQHALDQKKAVKVIAGIANTDRDHVLTIVRAATIARATAVDVSSSPDIVEAVRSETDLPVFVSCIDPKTLAQAASMGADVVELGNYDALYEQGLFFNHEEVLKLAQETRDLIAGDTLISVTIPGHLTLETQIRMAHALEDMGIDIIQSEGASRALALEPQMKTLSPAEKANINLRNTEALTRATRLPVLSASGISLDNVTDALDVGAAGVGIGSTVNKLNSQIQMITVIEQLMLKIAGHRMSTPSAKAIYQVS